MPSRLPTSAQSEPHRQLAKKLERHLACAWLQPIHSHTQAAFDRLDAIISQDPRDIVLDSGCGTGWASGRLAELYPDHRIIGVDRSEDRLRRAPSMPDHVHLVRAELSDFWRLAVEAQWPITDHFVLYPNPYPKAMHLKKRWHGHPIWPTLLNVAQRLIMRTNATVYAQEWRQALQWSGQAKIEAHELRPREVLASPISAFEKKYAESRHPLFEVISHRSPVQWCPD